MTEKEKAREGDGVMVFSVKVYWPLCRMILIDSDGHFLGDSELRARDSVYLCVSVCVLWADLYLFALCTASII